MTHPLLRLEGALLAVAALAGCTVGPDYHLLQQTAINRPSAQAPLSQSVLTTVEPLPPRWWALYDDPVLDALEEQALTANTDLRIAGANLARSAAIVRGAKGLADPQLAVGASVERARLSGESFLKFETIPITNLGIGGGQASYQLDLFGQIRRRVEAAKAEHEATEALVETVQVTVAAEVARAYISVCSENEAQELAEEVLATQERLADTARRLHAAGKTGALDVTRAVGLVLAARSHLPVHRAAARAALYRLAFLLGRAPSEYPRQAEACHALPQLKRPLPIGDGAALLARRPDVRVAERMLAASTAEIGVAKADLYPHISLGLGGGSFGLLADVGSAMAGHWSLGAMISWIFPTRAQFARVDAARAGADRSLADFDGTVLRALRETETALSWYRENHNRAVDLTQAREQAETLADLNRRLFQAGKAGLPADLSSQLDLVKAKDDERAAWDDVAQSQITLFLALGGGW
ncbi:efflux transporter outer membrane subunit [Novosphingobium album (ex Hu et al. 2023)]|uniref:Efflux transporter outer membrane subunit n=1 Tax=Novosphingobium album (ex Hu et al. 2023) TaxID=2930093 RepID=A0ABT0AW20_9SPHN|nr:efflux transporter outer membrane subunit [Novosphingobium album (ex Hu et al. 2023)]MCJ2176965.1 efflux transporter outer membrane subunit [Novosphingobium album (ex Hu et al. 2023)]